MIGQILQVKMHKYILAQIFPISSFHNYNSQLSSIPLIASPSLQSAIINCLHQVHICPLLIAMHYLYSYDYNNLMNNATFCLIPRGRRLGSYRFLEAMEFGCIPLLLSNGWVLPFADKIEWQRASVQTDERLLTLIPTIVREFTHEQIFKMKQQVLFLWNAYFSSIDRMVHTVFKVA